MSFKGKDLTGMKFGKLTVISRADDNISPSGYKTIMWNCMCGCGNKTIVRGKLLTGGITKSCGCLQKELMSKRQTIHGGYGTRLYTIWDSIRQRCNNPKCHAYKNYGGRGISVCDEWNDFSKFKQWATETGYDENADRGIFTIDRIDVDSNYCPENCRWSNMREQTNNRRISIHLSYRGETHALTEWADITGIKYCTIWRRYKNGLSPSDILKPVK